MNLTHLATACVVTREYQITTFFDSYFPQRAKFVTCNNASTQPHFMPLDLSFRIGHYKCNLFFISLSDPDTNILRGPLLHQSWLFPSIQALDSIIQAMKSIIRKLENPPGSNLPP